MKKKPTIANIRLNSERRNTFPLRSGISCLNTFMQHFSMQHLQLRKRNKGQSKTFYLQMTWYDLIESTEKAARLIGEFNKVAG